MIKRFFLVMLIFSPACLLWIMSEVLFILVFFFKLGSSIFTTLSMAAIAKFDRDLRESVYSGGIIGTTKKLIRTEIAEQMKALRLSSVFFVGNDKR